MPFLNLITNVKIPDTFAFAQEFSKVSAEILEKPEKYISVSYTYNDTLTFGGTFDPAFQLHITSLKNINAEANNQYALKLSDFLRAKLGLPDDRGYIVFYDPGVENVGYRSSTWFLHNLK
ncbi:hypothetical protein APHAL10511_007114 [Amanita phalloides]|nr:hypothetical protein APHAL10511_007114 [Amanita phalloides]